MSFEFGQKVKFKNYILKKPRYTRVDYQTMIEFCKNRKIPFREDKTFFGGYWFKTRLRVASFAEYKHGILIGKRNIDMNGYQSDYAWEFGDRMEVYIIAINLTSTYRVPIEYIEEDT